MLIQYTKRVFLKKESINEILLWIYISSAYPVILSNFEWYPARQIILVFSIGFLFAFFKRNRIVVQYRALIFIIILQLIYWLFKCVYQSDDAYLIIFLHSLSIIIANIFIFTFLDPLKLVKHFINFLVILNIFSVGIFILHFIFQFSPWFIYINKDGNIGYFYYLTSTNALLDWKIETIIRPAGVFDEPGAFALYSIYALLMNRLIGYSKKAEYIICICTLFTFSFAYYIFILLYVAFFYLKRKKFLIFCAGIFFSAMFINGLKDTKYNYFYIMTIERFINIGNPDGFSGNNRIAVVKTAFETFKKYPIFGSGENYLKGKPFHGANILYGLAVHGILGFLLIFQIPMMIFYKVFSKPATKILINKKLVLIWILVFIVFLQRPDFFGLFQTTVLLLLIFSVDVYKERVFLNRIMIQA